MRLGFDLDGTLADLHAALALEARRLFPGIDPVTLPNSTASESGSAEDGDAPPEGEAPGESDPAAGSRSSFDVLTSAQQRTLWKEVCARENFWETLEEIEPGVVARLYTLSRERRWEVIFLTSRPESAGDTAQLQSHRWLSAHGFETPSIFVVHGSRGKIASALALDALVDDRPENCLDVAIDSQARAILVWRGDEARVPGSAQQLGIGTVTSINQCLDLLESMDSTTQPGGVITRLMELLGLKSREKRSRDMKRPAPANPPPGTALTRG